MTSLDVGDTPLLSLPKQGYARLPETELEIEVKVLLLFFLICLVFISYQYTLLETNP